MTVIIFQEPIGSFLDQETNHGQIIIKKVKSLVISDWKSALARRMSRIDSKRDRDTAALSLVKVE